MALITDVRFAHENGALTGTLEALPDVVVGTVREASTAPGRNVYVFRFDGVDRDEVRSALEADHTVRRSTPVSAAGDRQLWGLEFAPETKLLGPSVTAEGGIVVDAQSVPERRVQRGWCERWFFPDHRGIHTVWTNARSEGFAFEVLDVHRLRSDAMADAGPLTSRQRTAIVTAYERGYFDEPRETSLEELADALECSPSAVHGRLKRGLRALVESLLVGGTDGRGPSNDEPEDAGYQTDVNDRPVRL
jgi:hypothetical protein